MGKKKIERVIHTLAFFGSKFGDFLGILWGIFFGSIPRGYRRGRGLERWKGW